MKAGLNKQEKEIVKKILEKYKNTVIFGSRVKGTHLKFSDLDICLKEKTSDYEYELLKEKFEKSDLPFHVDIVEYDKTSDAFKKIIDQDGILIDQLFT